MVATLDDTKRMAIAQKLADIRAFQNLSIKNEQRLISETNDSDIRDRLQNMLEDDQK
ncbi:MAG: DNA nickase, partial [Microcoleus sp. SIO2G3]|nr:DNA nickase [Microcoleus sp. SIO2G3]